MLKRWQRLLTAALLSSSVFAATWIWYHFTDKQMITTNSEKPLAFIGKTIDEIQRRPAARLLWQLVTEGEPLYNGEAIRTSEKGEVRIQFADTERYLDLEAESLIVIKKSEGEISLDLMEGSLFVKASNEKDKGPGLVLNSANGKVDISKATVSLSKSKGEKVNLQVLEGKAQIKTSDGKAQEISKGQLGSLDEKGFQFNKDDFKILAPQTQQPIYIDPENPESIRFRWTGLPKESRVQLKLGTHRKNLKLMGFATNLQLNEIRTPLAIGKHFWQLVAYDKNNQFLSESAIYKTELLPRLAPIIIYPTQNQEIERKEPFHFSFQWQKPESASQMLIEVWGDPGLTQKLLSKIIDKENTLSFPGLKPGDYSWRVSSYYSGSDTPVSGKIHQFKILNPDDKVIPIDLQWALLEGQDKQFYLEKPHLDLLWKASQPEKVSNYRLKFHEFQESLDQAKTVDLDKTQFKTELPKPGRYVASVEALDKKGRIMGTTGQKIIEVNPYPLIKAPPFKSKEGLIIATEDGKSTVEWEKLEEVKEYWVTLMRDGKQIQKGKYTTQSTTFTQLMPGDYQIEIFAIDKYGRQSENHEKAKISVPNKSNIKAPSLKKIKVN